jgi:glyoxylase-like metal-dependent hydrolase (beta-lactamase superfamily II)
LTALPEYEVFALRYGARSDWTRGKSYLNDANAGAPDSIEYFFWIIRNDERTIVVDTGFDAETAIRLGRKPFPDPATLLGEFGIDSRSVETLIVTHMHFDHIGALPSFPKARLHVQRADMDWATGPMMSYAFLKFPYESVHVAQMVEADKAGRITFHDGEGEVAPGITLHRIDGHATGLQAVRVNTKRGWVVLASDSAAYIEQFLDYRVSPAVVDAVAMLKGYDRLRELASSLDHIVTGHDPLTSRIYPAVPGIAARVFKLHESPSQSVRQAVDGWKEGRRS